MGKGEGGKRREGIEVGGGGDGYYGYCRYCRYGYGFVTDHKIMIHNHTCTGKGVISPAGYPYPCSSLTVLLVESPSHSSHLAPIVITIGSSTSG